ncbi:MAG: dodecin [Candidatus Melainabacteria bacterium]|nr:dodecin [Candidatus Melainabacteria bacterium]
MTEIVGTSNKSFADAAQQAVKRASKTLRDLRWFEVTDMRGAISEGQIFEFQVTLKVGFQLEE